MIYQTKLPIPAMIQQSAPVPLASSIMSSAYQTCRTSSCSFCTLNQPQNTQRVSGHHTLPNHAWRTCWLTSGCPYSWSTNVSMSVVDKLVTTHYRWRISAPASSLWVALSIPAPSSLLSPESWLKSTQNQQVSTFLISYWSWFFWFSDFLISP